MPIYKCDWMFALAQQGWTETFYIEADNSSKVFQTIGELTAVRVALLGTPAYVKTRRASNVALVNDSDIRTNIIPAKNQGDGQSSDQPNSCVLARFQSGHLYRRQCWLRGIPDSWIAFNAAGQFNPPPQLLANFLPWRDAIVNLANNVKIKALSKALPTKTVDNLTGAIGSFFTITSAAHGLANLDNVRIKGCQGDNVEGVNGVFEIFNADANTFQIPVAVTDNFNYIGGGTFRARLNIYPQIDNGELLRPSIHKTGLPLQVSRGQKRRTRQS